MRYVQSKYNTYFSLSNLYTVCGFDKLLPRFSFVCKFPFDLQRRPVTALACVIFSGSNSNLRRFCCSTASDFFVFPFQFDLCRLQLTILSIPICQEKRGLKTKIIRVRHMKCEKYWLQGNITGCLKGGILGMGSE